MMAIAQKLLLQNCIRNEDNWFFSTLCHDNNSILILARHFFDYKIHSSLQMKSETTSRECYTFCQQLASLCIKPRLDTVPGRV